jgi:hypothetical protein
MRFFVMLSGGIIRVSALNASDVEQGIAADLKELAFSHIREKPTLRPSETMSVNTCAFARSRWRGGRFA